MTTVLLSPFGFRRKKTPRTRPSSCCETCGARRGDSNAQPEMGEHQTEDRNEALHRGGISQLGFQEHAVSIKRITADPAKDTRQRINSVSSSCGAMPPAHPSSEVLPFDENDVTSSRRGSDQSPPQEMSSRYNASMREVISASTGVVDVGSRRPSILSIPMQGCGKSFSLRKISIGGQEESVPINSVVSRDMDGLPHSPSDLDERFASAIVIIPSPPPRIDFSDPFGGSGGFILEDGDTITSEARHIESRSVTDKEKRLEPSIWLSGGSEGQQVIPIQTTLHAWEASSIQSDKEIGDLFQAWKGFPSKPDEQHAIQSEIQVEAAVVDKNETSTCMRKTDEQSNSR